MKQKQLGSSGLALTRIGLGTWAIGGAGWQFSWGSQDDKDSIATIHRALDRGVTVLQEARDRGGLLQPDADGPAHGNIHQGARRGAPGQ